MFNFLIKIKYPARATLRLSGWQGRATLPTKWLQGRLHAASQPRPRPSLAPSGLASRHASRGPPDGAGWLARPTIQAVWLGYQLLHPRPTYVLQQDLHTSSID
jgi:hypothetical protein